MLSTKVDQNDLKHLERLYGNVVDTAFPCPVGVDGKINPHVTKARTINGTSLSVFHVKPVYYETIIGTWRPLSEVTYGFGNKWVHLRENWDEMMHPRYLSWLMKRMELLGGKVSVPVKDILSPLNHQNVLFTTLTAYPDPDPETTTVDGYCAEDQGSGVTWAALTGGSGNVGNDTASFDYSGVVYQAHTSTNQWSWLAKGVYLFDTSSISTDDIDSAIQSLYGATKADFQSNEPDLAFVATAPASNTAIAAGDFDSFGTSIYAPVITYSSFTASGYNDATYNATGEAAIAKTGVTKTGSCNKNYDIDQVAPTWQSGSVARMQCEFADETGTSKDPKLVVEHSAAGGGAVFRKTIIV